jgi:preprotein translocase subunit YajC
MISVAFYRKTQRERKKQRERHTRIELARKPNENIVIIAGALGRGFSAKVGIGR